MLTLITDASCGGPGCAGWGAWAKADGFESRFDGGAVAFKITCAQEAELASMVYGLRMAIAYAPGNDVLLQNDCMHALRQVRYRLGWPESQHRDGARIGNLPMQRYSENEQYLLANLALAAGSAGVLVTVRHVKAHVPGAKGRHWVNERCDAIAKGHMRAMRRALATPWV